MTIRTAPPLSQAISDVLSSHPQPIRQQLLNIRAMIFEVAADTAAVGPLTETLKWGEPAYLTGASKSGSTIRLGAPKARPDTCAVFFNCNTSLVAMFRDQFPKTFIFEGNRAVVVDAENPLPQAELALCLKSALTYHLNRRRGRMTRGTA